MNWQDQLKDYVNSIVTTEERNILKGNETMWGTTPYFASLMDRDDPNCPIRKQVIPSNLEQQNRYGMDDYLIWKENRAELSYF
ncbi:MAG: hypothetical protein QNK24_08375 [Desulfuromusa sp.]|nr:hypothetical protein [Desulfuromusa sp.]